MRSPIDPFTPAVELAAAIRRKEVSPVEVADALPRADRRARPPAQRLLPPRRRRRPPAPPRPPPTRSCAPRRPTTCRRSTASRCRSRTSSTWPAGPRRYGSAGASRARRRIGPRRAAVRRRRLRAARQDHHLRVRHRAVHRERGAGHLPQPVGPRPHAGRLVERRGAAVAAGMAPIAHGGDGGGSIRIPASCNGLVGLKPTRGLVTNATSTSRASRTSGVLTRTVADTAAALDVLARHDPAAWWSPPSPRDVLRRRADDGPADRAADRRARRSADRRAGASTRRARPPSTPPCGRSRRSGTTSSTRPCRCPRPTSSSRAFTTIWNVGAAGIAARRPGPGRAPQPGPARRRREPSTRGPTREACSRPSTCRAASSKAFVASFDLLVTPTMACLPPPVGAWRTGVRRRSADGAAQQLPDGRVHVAVQRDRPAGDLAARPPRRGHRPAGRRPDRRRARGGTTSCSRSPRTLELAHPWADRRPPVS